MIWIGIAIGAGVCMIAVVVGISALTWSVGRERALSAKLTDQYWRDSLEVQKRNADTFERILEELRKMTDDEILSDWAGLPCKCTYEKWWNCPMHEHGNEARPYTKDSRFVAELLDILRLKELTPIH